MIELKARKHVEVVVAPIGRGLARIGLRPIYLTIGGLLVTLVGSALLANGLVVVGALTILGGAALDGLDGPVARATNSSSARGALVDSVSDRLGEAAMFGACAFWLTSRLSPSEGDPALVVMCVLSLAAALITSYLRAKASESGVDGRGGIMGRAERVLLFTAGFIFNQVTVMLWLMTLLTWVTVLQRFHKTWQQLGE